MMLTCDDVTRLSFDTPDGVKLSFFMRLKLKLHRAICIWCKRYFNQTKFLRKAMKANQPTTDAALSDMCLTKEEKEKLKKTLQDANNSD